MQAIANRITDTVGLERLEVLSIRTLVSETLRHRADAQRTAGRLEGREPRTDGGPEVQPVQREGAAVLPREAGQRQQRRELAHGPGARPGMDCAHPASPAATDGTWGTNAAYAACTVCAALTACAATRARAAGA